MLPEFAEGIYHLPPTIKSFILHYDYAHPQTGKFMPPSLLEIQSKRSDALSIAVYCLSQQLEEFYVEGIFSSAIFGPADGSEKNMTSTPAWPHLKTVQIAITAAWISDRTIHVNASHRPYEDGENGQSGEPARPADYSRFGWDDEVCEVILVAAAQTASRMPCLEAMSILVGGIHPNPIFEMREEDPFDNPEELTLAFFNHRPDRNTISSWETVARSLTKGPRKPFTIDLREDNFGDPLDESLFD